MKRPPMHAFEERRLAALRRLQILDTAPEEAFDDLVRVAADVCQTPIALVSLVDRERQWFKAKVGIDACETPREVSFCAHAILQDGVFEIPDARVDERFADNPLVVGPPYVRFYAGAPLVTERGDPLGTLCVIDYQPRTLTEAQRFVLGVVGRQVVARLALKERADPPTWAGDEPRGLPDVVARVLDRTCRYMGWSAGLVYAIDERGGFGATEVSYSAGEGYRRLLHEVAASRSTTLGELLQKTVAAGRAEWLVDFDDDAFGWAGAARALGLRIALAFPVLAGADVVGIVLCFAAGGQAPDEQLIEVISQIGVDLGRALQRQELPRDPGRNQQARDDFRAEAAELAAELERRTRSADLTSEMADVLQRCREMSEVVDVVGEYAARLFPGSWGSLALIDARRGLAETGAVWGASTGSSLLFDSEACLAVRVGRMHETPREGGMRCGHLPEDGGVHLCVPALSQGKPLGVLTVSTHGDVAPLRRPAVCTAEYVALALANHKLRELVREQAMRDPLTGLYTLRSFLELLEREVARGTRQGLCFAVCIFDMDRLDLANERHGHEAIDALLRKAADCLLKSTRKQDFLARMAGGRFALALPGASGEWARAHALVVRQTIAALTVTHRGESVGPFHAFFGVGSWPACGPSVGDALRAAEEAMRDAKVEARVGVKS